MLNIDSGPSPSTTGKTFKDSVRTHLNAFADRHLELIAQRPNRRQLTALVREETQASKQLPEILMRLFGGFVGMKTYGTAGKDRCAKSQATAICLPDR